MNYKELQKPEFAIDFLSEHLINGTLVLFLGAGSSKGFGLPNWLVLTNEFRKKVGLKEIDAKITSPEQIQQAFDEALDVIDNDEVKKMEIIQTILYNDLDNLNVKLAYSHHLLVSISSLLMGSSRGHISKVVTLNYDSMLEWFLSLFGFKVNSISKLPALEGSEDVRIYHPHGFAPHPKLNLQQSDFLILGMKDANNRLGNRGGDIWFEKLRQIMESAVCLFIGLSENTLSDRAIAPLLSATGDLFKDERPLGIWINKSDISDEKKAEYFRNNIAPVVINDVDGIAEFVLKISQRAIERQQLK